MFIVDATKPFSSRPRCLEGEAHIVLDQSGCHVTKRGRYSARIIEKSPMNATALLVGLALTTFVATASPVLSQPDPPPSERANQVEALVTKAAALIDSTGKSAFADLRKKDSEWFHGDTYPFVYDMNANVLLNPAFPKREGTNVSGQKDAKGKLFHNEIIKTAETKGSGWVDYMFPKPGQTEPSQKWTFVKKVTIDGTAGLVAQASTRNRD